MPKTILSLLLVACSFFSTAQTAVPDKIVDALDSFSFIRPQEKAYLQTDRNGYVAGESIWFKTYTLLNERPTILSKVIYVDLVNQEGSIVEKKMLKLKNGTASGVMDLKTDIPAGAYQLRCYTLWMLNFPDFIFVKQVSIFSNTKNDKATNNAVAAAPLKLSFFPEGGSLVAGVKSTVAFKALDAGGNPVSVNGDIINTKNEKVATFKSVHDGMGNFEFTPLTGETYKAVVQTGPGTSKDVPLPASKNEGIVLSADNSSAGKIFIKVTRAEKNKDKYNNLLLVAQLNYQVAYVGKLNMDEGLDAAAINKKNFPSGILQITVLTEAGQPLAERLVFISNYNPGNPLLQATTTDLDKRKKNVWVLDAAGFSDLQAAVSITNAGSGNGQYAPGILSSFLLSSDLKGNIHEPGYYFKDKEPETLQHLDLLMMVHGWRRYNLEEIMANRFPPLHYPFETGLSITGKVMQSNGKSVLKDGKINLVIRGEDSTRIMAEGKTNESSVFVVSDLEFRKSAAVYYQGTNVSKNEAIVSVKIDSAYFDTLARTAPNDVLMANTVSVPLLEKMASEKATTDTGKSKTLREVVLRAKKRSVADSLNLLYASDLFFNSDQTLTLNPNINYYDMWQFLRMNVPGIAINQTDTGTQVNFSRYQGIELFSENTTDNSVQFFLNEVAVNISLIESLDPSDVAMVKVYKGNTGIALGAIRGAIAIYTTKGKSTRDWRQKGFDFFNRSGYSANREFYEMDYSKVKQETVDQDIRTTLYWNPEIKVKDGKAIIEFYNDDVCKKYKVVVEGMDKNGRLLHAEKEVQ